MLYIVVTSWLKGTCSYIARVFLLMEMCPSNNSMILYRLISIKIIVPNIMLAMTANIIVWRGIFS